MSSEVIGFEWTKSKRKFLEASNSRLAGSLDIVQLRGPGGPHVRSALRSNATSDWPLKNRSRNVSPLTADFQAIVALSRLVGCHPHPFLTSARNLRTTGLAKLYSLIWVAVLTVALAFETRDFVRCRVEGMEGNELCTLTIGNSIIVTLAHLMCVALAVLRAGNFEAGLRKIQDFDEATCAGGKFNARANLATVAALLATLGFGTWCHELTIPVDNPLVAVYRINVCVMSLEVLKFCLVFLALTRRFARLKALASAGRIDVGSAKGVYYQPLTVQHVFILNQWLAEAAENFNKYFDVQVVYWIVYFIADLIIFAFVMSIWALTSSFKLNETVRLALLFYHPSLICIAAHFTSKRANELGGLLFGRRTQSLDTTVSSLEILELGYYLYRVPVKVTGMKMFCIDLPLLLSILEITATYTTFVLQNTKEIYNKLVVNNGTEIK